MKPLARWGLRHLDRTRYFQSKPLLAPLLRTLWRYLRAATPEAGEAAVRSLTAGRLADYPFLFRDRHGLEYLLYPGQNAEVYLAHDGNYEVGETEYCRRRIQPGMTVFDVGANIGLYTLLFAKCAGPRGRVHAFEPEPRNFRRLLVNVAINCFENVTANPTAVYSESRPVTLNVFPETVHALHSLGRAAAPPSASRPGQVIEPERTLTVPATTLDDYCAAQSLERIDYLKVDVEGAEFDVLRGAAGLLARQAVDVIQFEVAPAAGAPDPAARDLFAYLQGCGFGCHPIGPTGDLLGQVSAAREGLSNYAAVKR